MKNFIGISKGYSVVKIRVALKYRNYGKCHEV